MRGGDGEKNKNEEHTAALAVVPRRGNRRRRRCWHFARTQTRTQKKKERNRHRHIETLNPFGIRVPPKSSSAPRLTCTRTSTSEIKKNEIQHTFRRHISIRPTIFSSPEYRDNNNRTKAARKIRLPVVPLASFFRQTKQKKKHCQTPLRAARPRTQRKTPSTNIPASGTPAHSCAGRRRRGSEL